MRLSRTLLVLGACALLAVPAFAADGKHLVRFGGTYISPTGDYSEYDPDFEETLTIEADSAVGGYAGYEYRLSDRLGVEAALQFANHDVEGSAFGVTATIGDIDFMPFTIALDVHLLQESSIDLYVAPMVGYTFFSDLSLVDESDEIAVDDAFTYGAQVGVDIPLGESAWGIQAAGQYLFVSADADNGDGTTTEVDINPFVFQAGVRVKF